MIVLPFSVYQTLGRIVQIAQGNPVQRTYPGIYLVLACTTWADEERSSWGGGQMQAAEMDGGG